MEILLENNFCLEFVRRVLGSLLAGILPVLQVLGGISARSRQVLGGFGRFTAYLQQAL